MKKVLLALLVTGGISAFAQDAVTTPTGVRPATEKEMTRFLEAKNLKLSSANKKAKANGGVVSQRMSHADIADDQFGTLLSGYIAPIFQDSTVLQDFGTLTNVNTHGYGQTFDVYTPAHGFIGLDYFDPADPYTVDTIYTAGFYDAINNNTGAFTGDTLYLDIVYGDPSLNTMWRQGLSYPPNTWSNQPTRADSILPIRFTGSTSHGFAGQTTWSNKITIKKALTPADTNVTYHKFVPSTPIQVPAGSIFGVALRFKSGESYNPGDVYFAGANSSSTAVLNSFRVFILGADAASDNTAYFLEKYSLGISSWASSQPLQTDPRYTAANDRFYTPQGGLAAAFDIWVSGESTVSLDEEKLNNNVALYPNPTTGNVSIAISQGGTYNLEVVNMLGQVVHAEEVTVSGNEELKRDLSHLTKGIYLVNIKGDNYSSTSKLTINK